MVTHGAGSSGALGAYIRAQRKMADLSLRQLGEMTQVSNAYLSQLERGLHQPSLRILRSIADALAIPWEELMAQAGALGDGLARDVARAGSESGAGGGAAGAGANGTVQGGGNGDAPSRAGATERAILTDPHLSAEERAVLLQLYRTLRARHDDPV